MPEHLFGHPPLEVLYRTDFVATVLTDNHAVVRLVALKGETILAACRAVQLDTHASDLAVFCTESEIYPSGRPSGTEVGG